MTARTCPVHGEYSATGACRWCEKPSGMDQSTITLPLMCICKTCLRGFEAPIPLTSLECPECRAKSQPAPLSKGVSLPGLKGLWQKPDRVEVNEAGVPTYTWTIGPEVDSFEKLARVANVDDAPLLNGRNILDAMHDAWVRIIWARLHDDMVETANFVGSAAQQESRLLAQHAALRWERVARRWNWKHCEPRWINEEWRAYVWRCWLEQMALRREGNLIAAGIPKGWP